MSGASCTERVTSRPGCGAARELIGLLPALVSVRTPIWPLNTVINYRENHQYMTPILNHDGVDQANLFHYPTVLT